MKTESVSSDQLKTSFLTPCLQHFQSLSSSACMHSDSTQQLERVHVWIRNVTGLRPIMYNHLHIHTPTCRHAHAQAQSNHHTRIRTRRNIHSHLHIHVYAHMHTHIHAYMRALCACLHTCAYGHVSISIYTC